MIPRLATALVLVAAAALGPDSPAAAQSLADVAKREAERRGTSPGTGKVYTNGDLKPDPNAPAPAPPQPTSTPPRPGAAPGSEAAPGTSADPSASATGEPQAEVIQREVKGEDYWRGRAQLIRGRIEKQRAQITALEGRVSAMASAQGAGELQERDITRQALAKSRSDLAYLDEEWTNFEATAREKKVPEAWIR